jgi:hypothetical protein
MLHFQTVEDGSNAWRRSAGRRIAKNRTRLGSNWCGRSDAGGFLWIKSVKRGTNWFNMPSDNESTFSDGPLDIRLMSNDQVLDYFLNETFEHPACGLGGDLAHFLWGSKPAIFDDDEPPCLSRLFKQEGDRNINPNFLSIKVYPAKSPRLDAEGNETWDAHCTLIINRTNFAQLVKNDPEYFRPRWNQSR